MYGKAIKMTLFNGFRYLFFMFAQEKDKRLLLRERILSHTHPTLLTRFTISKVRPLMDRFYSFFSSELRSYTDWPFQMLLHVTEFKILELSRTFCILLQYTIFRSLKTMYLLFFTVRILTHFNCGLANVISKLHFMTMGIEYYPILLVFAIFLFLNAMINYCVRKDTMKTKIYIHMCVLFEAFKP